jgi:hypothetical protein
MKNRALFTSHALIFALLICSNAARAQEHDAPKVEIGVEYSSLSINLPGFGGTENAAGFGARVTYNFNDYFAVEAEGNVFPTGTRAAYVTGGAAQQAQFGVKAGKRWNRFGVFAKARPGFVSFGNTFNPSSEVVTFGGGSFISTQFNPGSRKTHFSTDVGGVLEFYPSRRVLVRFDAGDTIIRFGEHDEVINPIAITPRDERPLFRAPAETTHNFQFTAGIGFRFRGGADTGGGASSGAGGRDRVRRFEVGVQFSSLLLRLSPESFGFPFFPPFDDGSEAEAGFGGRVGYNITDNLAVEAEGNFYPRKRESFTSTVGGYPAQMQFGVKYGRRYHNFGIFAKARPGFVGFSRVASVTGTETFTFGGETFTVPTFGNKRRNYFSTDLGGVLEYYPTRRIFTRFDLGDTIIRYGERDNIGIFLAPAPAKIPSEIRHNLQFTGGIGLRF